MKLVRSPVCSSLCSRAGSWSTALVVAVPGILRARSSSISRAAPRTDGIARPAGATPASCAAATISCWRAHRRARPRAAGRRVPLRSRRLARSKSADRIARGDVFCLELVVPEGKNMFDIAAAAEQLGLFPAAEFLEAARDPAMIRDLDPAGAHARRLPVPRTPTRLSRHTTPERLCRMMTGKFREVWQALKPDADVHRTVTLASLVEKEGKLAEERPQIAAVFANRLRIGMKLDCDPTTIYAALLAGRYTRRDPPLATWTARPYNTYRHAGLPPGPIANPGLASRGGAASRRIGRPLFRAAAGRLGWPPVLQQHRGARRGDGEVPEREEESPVAKRALIA